MQLSQRVLPTDQSHHLQYNIKVTGMVDAKPDFWMNIFIRGQVYFTISGGVFKHNCSIFGTYNPHKIQEMLYHFQKEIVCVNTISVLFFFRDVETEDGN